MARANPNQKNYPVAGEDYGTYNGGRYVPAKNDNYVPMVDTRLWSDDPMKLGRSGPPRMIQNAIAMDQQAMINARGQATARQYDADINAQLRDPNSPLYKMFYGNRANPYGRQTAEPDINLNPDEQGLDLNMFDESGALRVQAGESPIGQAANPYNSDQNGSSFDENLGFTAGRTATKGLEFLTYLDAARKIDATKAARAASQTASGAAFASGGSQKSIDAVNRAISAEQAANAASKASTRLGIAGAVGSAVGRNQDTISDFTENVANMFMPGGESRYFPSLNNVPGLTRQEIETNRNNLFWQNSRRGMAGLGNLLGDYGRMASRGATGFASGLTFGGTDAILGSFLPDSAVNFAGIDRDPLGVGRLLEDVFTEGQGRGYAPSPGRGFSPSQNYLRMGR